MMSVTLDQLRGLLRPPLEKTGAVVSTGLAELDRLLPEGGYRAGSLVEWVSPPASGAATLAFFNVQKNLREGQAWCLIDWPQTFCPTPVFSAGLAERCLVMRPRTWADALWTTEQVLRCPAVAVTWVWANDVAERVLRRWKLAAEEGGGIGVLFRPVTAARQGSWADVRWRVEPRATLPNRRLVPREASPGGAAAPLSGSERATEVRRTWCVELMYCKGGFAQGRAVLEQDHATGRVHLAAELAHPEASAVA